MSEIVKQTYFHKCKLVLLNCQNLDDERGVYSKYLSPNIVSIEYRDYVKLYHTWNDAMYFYPSKYFINANIDDRWHPKYVEHCVRFLDEYQEYGVVAGNVAITSEMNCVWPRWVIDDRMKIMYPGSTMGPSPMWRKQLIDEYGGFANYYSIGDARMWEKWLYQHQVKFGVLHDPNPRRENSALVVSKRKKAVKSSCKFKADPNTDYILYYRNPNSLERRRDNCSGLLLSDIDRSM